VRQHEPRPLVWERVEGVEPDELVPTIEARLQFRALPP
jgi:hypothetical protein